MILSRVKWMMIKEKGTKRGSKR